ncbi:glycosyltransferase [Rhodospirillales bacterium]|nr:glycosyltransferase [Rhodospirillales bacterium]
MGILQLTVILSLIIWVILIFFRGNFWLADQMVETDKRQLEIWPSIAAIIPARNEEKYIGTTLRSLMAQNYPGKMDFTVVNDNSTDNTVEVITQIKGERIVISNGSDLPEGWTGKLWALGQGINLSIKKNPSVDFYLFTDADIEHSQETLKIMVTKAERENLQLVSLMVLLNCRNFWEILLIPAFVFFFQKLYPFQWINNPKKPTAGAAGGYILVRRTALEAAGGIDAVHGEIIDDCAIGRMIKKNGSIWLGLTRSVKSLRTHTRLSEIWEMVTRTAFNQLNYSIIILLVTTIGMIVIYLIPPFAVVWGLVFNDNLSLSLGVLCWVIMAIAYLPTLRLYQRPFWESLILPVAAFLYSLMVVDSAQRHWTKRYPSWKGRKYP